MNSSDTESYDSFENSLNQLKQKLINKSKVKPKRSSLKNKREVKSKQNNVINANNNESFAEEKGNHLQEMDLSLNDLYYNKDVFVSQYLSSSQMSSLIQQNGRFTYYLMNDSFDNYSNETTLKLRQNVEFILKPLASEETNGWTLLLQIINEDLFAFRKRSTYSIVILQKVLAHYDWSDMKETVNNNDLIHLKQLHNKVVTTFMREMALSCYTRDDILSLMSGSQLEDNAWTFVSKLISFIIVETMKESNEDSFALIHLTLIIELLSRDFEDFLRESTDYCNEISRIDRNENCKPLVVRLIWSTKNPNYINSVLKHLVFLITKSIKCKNNFLSIELFKLFELCAESLRIGSGNVRPFISFGFIKTTLINELFQQLSAHTLTANEVVVQLFSLISTLSWAKLQLCTHLMLRFVDSQTTQLFSRKQISLEMIISCFMTANINIFETSLAQKPNSPLKPLQSTKKSSRKRSSFGLITRSPVKTRKSWSKKNAYGENKLHICCKNGDSDQLKLLLQSAIDGFGFDPNETDNNGYSPLCEAAFNGHLSCIQELIDWEKNSNKKLNYELGPKLDKQTALHDAVQNNHLECAQLIIESGGLHLLDVKRNDGKTPKDLINSSEMKRMIEKVYQNKKEPMVRLNINNTEEANLFIVVLKEMLISYIETTKIDHFIGLSSDLWENKFNQIFSRDANQIDINHISQDFKSIEKLPNIWQYFKESFKFQTNINGLFDDLDIVIDSLLISD